MEEYLNQTKNFDKPITIKELTVFTVFGLPVLVLTSAIILIMSPFVFGFMVCKECIK